MAKTIKFLIFAFILISSVFLVGKTLAQNGVNPIRNSSVALDSAEINQTHNPTTTEPESTISNEVNVYFFWGDGCPHCEKEKIFLNGLKEKHPQLNVRDFEVWKNSENRKIYAKFDEKLNASISGRVPFTVIGDKYITGYLNGETTGAEIEKAVKQALETGCRDIGAEILGEIQKENGQKCEGDKSKIPDKVKVPIIGEISIKNFSLPALTAVFGLLDGFNPCSMWALVFLISLLISFGNKKRLLILGSTFIITSAFSYFLFMSAWLNLFLFLGFLVWVRIIVGLAALASGYYNLKKYFTEKEAACEISRGEKTKNILVRLKESVNHHNLLWALIGVIALAFSVNLVELICSAGFPAIYTQVLSLSHLPEWQYYSYIGAYVFFYDLDEIVVLALAFFTFRITIASHKYARWSRLIGGILMLILGILLIFRHQWLMWG